MTGQQRVSMTKRSLLVALLALGLAALGGWLALRSPMLGRAMADALLRDQGAGMATEVYLALLRSAAAAYRLVGAVLLAVGLWWALRLVGGAD